MDKVKKWLEGSVDMVLSLHLGVCSWYSREKSRIENVRQHPESEKNERKCKKNLLYDVYDKQTAPELAKPAN